MTALQTAIALAEVERLAFAVSQDLEFDMPRVFDVLLDVDGRVGERAFGFGTGRVVAFDEARVVVGHAHAATTAATRSLDDDRIANLAGDLQRILLVIDRTVTAGHDGHSRLAHRLTGRDLVTHGDAQGGSARREMGRGQLS